MARIILLLGAINAFLSVMLGAFGAHAIRARVTAELLATYQSGVQYHQMHALALLLTGVLLERAAVSPLAQWSGWLFAAGILLFSGSLYVYVLTTEKTWALITPFGGLCFLSGWAILTIALLRNK